MLTDAACAGFDPVFKMNPPLREQRDVDALRAGLARRHDRRDRHRPRAARARDQGRAVRGGAARDARRRDRARGRAHDARRAGRARRSPQALGRAVVAAGAHRRPRRRRARRPGRARPPREPLRDRPRARRGSSTPTAAREPVARTRRATAGSSPARSATPSSRGDTDRPRRRAHPMSRSAIDDAALLVLRRRRDVRGRARRAPARVDGVAAGEVVFNTALVGLPGDRHRPVVRGPDHHVHLPAHRQLRRQRRRRRSARRRTAAA